LLDVKFPFDPLEIIVPATIFFPTVKRAPKKAQFPDEFLDDLLKILVGSTLPIDRVIEEFRNGSTSKGLVPKGTVQQKIKGIAFKDKKDGKLQWRLKTEEEIQEQKAKLESVNSTPVPQPVSEAQTDIPAQNEPVPMEISSVPVTPKAVHPS
jgi:hypothetical protein